MSEKILKATHQGILSIGTINIPCAVLEDTTRVISEKSIASSLGALGGGAYWRRRKSDKDGTILPRYVSTHYLTPFISDGMREKLLNPIHYKPKVSGVKKARGVDATLLPDICDVWIKAKDAGTIPKAREGTVEVAKLLMRGFAKIGIIGLIDETTGFQEIRDREALQKILNKFIAEELRPWVKTFPDEFYREMFKLRNWQYSPISVKRPKYVGKITNDIIYDRLAPGVLDRLQEIIPKDEKGRRKVHFHRKLTEDWGVVKLTEHISNVTTLMKAAPNYKVFKRLLERAFPANERTIEIPYDVNNIE